MASVESSVALIEGLRKIHSFPQSYLECENGNRRSSVAIVLRFRGFQHNDDSGNETPTIHKIETFLSQLPEKVDPEILFIKRATSERDRWSSHIALPGGKCETDETDLEAAVREAYEEVGLDLTQDGIYVGPLDQRLLKVSWGTKAIMTLCPFVFILTNPNAQVEIQPTEVATAFWYPISQILDPTRRSIEAVGVAGRLNLEKYRLIPTILHSWIYANVGKLNFAAIDLFPSSEELLHSDTNIDLSDPPYKLWGVTYSVLTDFFCVIDPPYPQRIRAKDIKPPILRNWDMRFFLWILSFRHLQTRRREVDTILNGPGCIPGSMDLANRLLEGYFRYPRLAIFTGITFRTSLAMYVIFKLIRTAISRRR